MIFEGIELPLDSRELLTILNEILGDVLPRKRLVYKWEENCIGNCIIAGIGNITDYSKYLLRAVF